VTEFQKCLDRTDPVPFSTIRGIIQQELRGRSIDSVFASIDPQPLASASVAQVRAHV
jgi:aarF domain-containing kinase